MKRPLFVNSNCMICGRHFSGHGRSNHGLAHVRKKEAYCEVGFGTSSWQFFIGERPADPEERKPVVPSGNGHRFDEAVTAAEEAVHFASNMLKRRIKDPKKKLKLMWNLAYIELRDLEEFRPAGGFEK